MELRHQRYFVAVAGNCISPRAAKRLGIKQPALSLQIRQLGQEKGKPLFRREMRGVKLTESGALLPDEARRILDSAFFSERPFHIVSHRIWCCSITA
jgi:DNA-binding transcriptional LysR family regulator